jgi:hypothetical protein
MSRSPSEALSPPSALAQDFFWYQAMRWGVKMDGWSWK